MENRQCLTYHFIVHQKHDSRQQLIPVLGSLRLLIDQSRKPLNRLAMKIHRLLLVRHPTIFHVRAGEGVDGVHDRGALGSQGQDQLPERVSALLAEDDEVAEAFAEVGDEGAPIRAI